MFIDYMLMVISMLLAKAGHIATLIADTMAFIPLFTPCHAAGLCHITLLLIWYAMPPLAAVNIAACQLQKAAMLPEYVKRCLPLHALLP